MNWNERLMTVLLSPVISEKSTDAGDKLHTAVFKVCPQASKKDVQDAVEKLFEVKVKKVGILNVKGKRVRVRGHAGCRKNTRKAYVRLKEGYDINFSELQ